MLFSLFLKAKRIRKKEFILTSPHPTLPSKGGLKGKPSQYNMTEYHYISNSC